MKYYFNVKNSHFTAENYRFVILLVALNSCQNWSDLLKEWNLLRKKLEQLQIGQVYWLLFSEHNTAYHSFTSLFVITK
jgi:hypothetical protein